MLSTQVIFLIAALLCFMTFLVLLGVSTNRIDGMRQIRLAALLGIVGNILYAFGRELPPLLAYEAANAVYAAASASLFVGYRLLFKRRAYARAAAVSVLVFTALIAIFHYWFDSFVARSSVVSLYHAAVGAGIALTLIRCRSQWDRPFYVKRFILFVCSMKVLGHVTRVAWQLLGPAQPTSLLQPSPGAIFFLSVATVGLPALAFGGMLLAHRRIVEFAQEAADHDYLTGVLSRRAFSKIGERELGRAARTGRPLALLLIDLDHFKPINDNYGHDAGDRALVAFTLNAEKVLRGMDFLGRIGGDEFAVWMPETDLAAATVAAHRLRRRVAALGRTGALPGVTLSIGVSVLHDGDSLESVMKRADVALYEAKRNGRDQVVTEPEGGQPAGIGECATLQMTRTKTGSTAT
ncbi:GGDEF domain-containing protein [Massilia solisilvae]